MPTQFFLKHSKKLISPLAASSQGFYIFSFQVYADMGYV